MIEIYLGTLIFEKFKTHILLCRLLYSSVNVTEYNSESIKVKNWLKIFLCTRI